MLPQTIIPMEPVLVPEPPVDPSFLHSVKWDGVRQVVFVSGTGVRIHNRKLRERTEIYPELHQLSKLAVGRDLVFDGEVIALNNEGKPDFSRVTRRDNCRSETAIKKSMREVPVFYMIFDLLYYRGENIMHFPLCDRLELLQQVLPSQTGVIQTVSHEKDGGVLFQRTRDLGLEGVVSKEGNSKYVPGSKSKAWVKAKHFKEMSVVVGGFTTKVGVLNSLSVGAFGVDGQLYYLGNVSTGLSGSHITFLDTKLRKSLRPLSPFINYRRKAPNQFWTDPELTLKVKYLEITGDFRLRHPVIIDFC